MHHAQAQNALEELTAQESAAESGAVLTLIARFTNAWNTKDVDSILALQHSLDRRAVTSQLSDVKKLALRISPISPPEISGTHATVTCRRQADETFSDGSIKQNPELVVTYLLAKRNGAWFIEGSKVTR
jgi:hypothetical protein